MAGHFIPFNGGVAHINCPNIYRYRGVTFEWHNYLGPLLCRKDGEPSKRNIGRKTGAVISAWHKLSPSKKKRTLIYS